MLRFATLPDGFPKLREMAAKVSAMFPIQKPDTAALGLRIRRLYAHEAGRGYEGIRSIHLRQLPYAYFVDGLASLSDEHPELLARYWDTELPQALTSPTRRARRWLAPLLLVYVERFTLAPGEFAAFAKSLRLAVVGADPASDLLGMVQEAQKEYRFLQPAITAEDTATRVAANFVRGAPPFPTLLLKLNVVDTAFGEAVMRAFLSDGKNDFKSRELIYGVLHWAGQQSTSIGKTSNRALFAERLLSAWLKATPPDDVRRTITEFLIRHYTDPRIGGNRQVNWQGVSDEAIGVLMRWLAGDTLRAFIKILERTADEIWEYRRKFWMAYYDAGYVDEVWLALGRDARYQARYIDSLADSKSYAGLSGLGVQREHSVLLIKIGGLIFTEWSHNGSLRAHREDDSMAPRFYRKEYDGDDLRQAGSMDFHEKRLVRPQLSHHTSETGGWQRIARDFIRKHTGIYLRDSDII